MALGSDAGASRLQRLAQLFRFYQAAMLNTLFGFGVFAVLIRLGVNLYVAQVVAQLLGIAFNYVTYSRHVFRDQHGGKLRFIAAYGVNYLVNLAFLAFFHRIVRSGPGAHLLERASAMLGAGPLARLDEYVAGFLATVSASLVNYFALKHVVFVERRVPA